METMCVHKNNLINGNPPYRWVTHLTNKSNIVENWVSTETTAPYKWKPCVCGCVFPVLSFWFPSQLRITGRITKTRLFPLEPSNNEQLDYCRKNAIKIDGKEQNVRKEGCHSPLIFSYVWRLGLVAETLGRTTHIVSHTRSIVRSEMACWSKKTPLICKVLKSDKKGAVT